MVVLSLVARPRAPPVTMSCVTFVNPLEVDGFAEPDGWGTTPAAEKPVLYFLPGMDGSLSTPFMQYCELSTTFELACMQHTDGLESRATFDELSAACADAIAASVADGRQVLLVGESFGATLALAAAHELQARGSLAGVRGLVLVNPATSYRRSTLAAVGPLIAALSGPLLAPLYYLALVAFAALVLTPVYQAPSFLSTISAQKATELNNNRYREAWVGRVAMGAYLNQRSEQLAIGPLLAINVFEPEQLGFRLSEWLAYGADQVAERDVAANLELPVLGVVGDLDRLLPSVDEAERLRAACGPARWRGTTVVQGAGHASTLGNRVDLLEEIRAAFAADFEPPLPPRLDLVNRAEHPGDDGDGWERGLLDRTYPPLDPADYTQMNRGGSLFVGTSEPSRSRSGDVRMQLSAVLPPARTLEVPVAGLRDAVRLRVAEDPERLASEFLQRLPSRTADDVGFYGAVLWPGSVLIAELLAQGPPLDGATVLCLGAGTGLEALVAALCGANALATDVYPFALSLVTEAAALNGVADRVDVAAFDVTRRGAPLPPAEIVLLGDLLYLTDLTAAVAQRVAEAAARGSVVLLADSRRTHQEQLIRALGELGVEASFEERTLSSGEAVSLLQYQTRA